MQPKSVWQFQVMILRPVMARGPRERAANWSSSSPPGRKPPRPDGLLVRFRRESGDVLRADVEVGAIVEVRGELDDVLDAVVVGGEGHPWVVGLFLDAEERAVASHAHLGDVLHARLL
eukprot:13486313-Alexandrium_andersonii.AAC.1